MGKGGDDFCNIEFNRTAVAYQIHSSLENSYITFQINLWVLHSLLCQSEWAGTGVSREHVCGWVGVCVHTCSHSSLHVPLCNPRSFSCAPLNHLNQSTIAYQSTQNAQKLFTAITNQVLAWVWTASTRVMQQAMPRVSARVSLWILLFCSFKMLSSLVYFALGCIVGGKYNYKVVVRLLGYIMEHQIPRSLTSSTFYVNKCISCFVSLCTLHG